MDFEIKVICEFVGGNGWINLFGIGDENKFSIKFMVWLLLVVFSLVRIMNKM